MSFSQATIVLIIFFINHSQRLVVPCGNQSFWQQLSLQSDKELNNSVPKQATYYRELASFTGDGVWCFPKWAVINLICTQLALKIV